MLDDWASIPSAGDRSSFNVLRADSSHPLDFRVGRDHRGRFVFQLDAAGFASGAGAGASPAGMDVLLDPVGENRSRLTLLLHDSDDFDIFRILCADLLEITRGHAPEDASQAMHMLLGRLHQWQEILARRRQSVLTRSEIMGLVGEILFLRDLLLPRLDAAAAVGAWRGPYGDEQDFALADTIFEVKTQGTTADRRIEISSEDQLDTAASRIILCQQGLAGCAADDEEGISLNGLVRGIRERIGDAPAAVARLDLGLAAARWDEQPDYEDRWRLVDRTFFEVGEDFPRIVRADLRPGVEGVRYRIRVADCRSCRVDIEETMQELLG